MTIDDKFLREFSQQMLRAMVQSVFVSVFNEAKRTSKLSQSGLAKRLGINRSVISRNLSDPPNWTVDKISDMAEALNVDIEIIARNRVSGQCHTARGVIHISVSTATGRVITVNESQTLAKPSISVNSPMQSAQGISMKVSA